MILALIVMWIIGAVEIGVLSRLFHPSSFSRWLENHFFILALIAGVITAVIYAVICIVTDADCEVPDYVKESLIEQGIKKF